MRCDLISPINMGLIHTIVPGHSSTHSKALNHTRNVPCTANPGRKTFTLRRSNAPPAQTRRPFPEESHSAQRLHTHLNCYGQLYICCERPRDRMAAGAVRQRARMKTPQSGHIMAAPRVSGRIGRICQVSILGRRRRRPVVCPATKTTSQV